MLARGSVVGPPLHEPKSPKSRRCRRSDRKLSRGEPGCYADRMADTSAKPSLADSTLGQHQALLEVTEAIAQHRDLGELFHDLAQRLHRLVQFDYLNLVLHDASHQVMRLHILETLQPMRIQPGLEFPISETPAGWVWETQQPFLVADIEQETRYPAVTQMLKQEQVKAFCLLPLTTAQRRLGAPLRRSRSGVHAAGGQASGGGGGQRTQLPERADLPAATGAGARPLARAARGEQRAGFNPRPP